MARLFGYSERDTSSVTCFGVLDFLYLILCTALLMIINSISISCFLNSLRKLYCFDAKFRDHSINNRLI